MIFIALIYVDEREKNSNVPRILLSKGMSIVFKMLIAGDYVIDNVIGIERKTANDFINSLIDGRLFDQLNRLRENYEKAILIIEGNIHKTIRSRNIHRNAILGSYASIILDLDVYTLNTKDEEETAEIIKRMTLRNTKTKYTSSSLHKPKLRTLSEWQKFVLQCFPHIGPKIAQRILEYFGSIHTFCNATIHELSRLEGLNEKKAGEIYQLIHTIYKNSENKLTKNSTNKKSILDYLR